MDFGFTAQEDKFREELHQFLEREVTWDTMVETREYGMAYGPLWRGVLRKMGARGWLTPTWPPEYGGLGASEATRFIMRDELTYAWGPFELIGAAMTGPTILGVGSDELKKKLLPAIASGEVEYALGYTETEAGSDLAALDMRAEDKGDYFLINGQKMFNTHCHMADYHWLAARTDPNVPRHRGISMMVVDLKTPGITIRPLITMAGWRTNEVFYDDVKVPKENLVGEKNRGFYYLMAALDYERMWPMGRYQRLFDELVQYVRETKRDGKPLSADPLIGQKLAELAIEIEVNRLLYYQLAYILDRGEVPNYQSSMQKIFATELGQHITEAGMEITGLCGQLMKGSKWALFDGAMEHYRCWSVIETVGGGSSEIMRNIIAIRGLGLPRE